MFQQGEWMILWSPKFLTPWTAVTLPSWRRYGPPICSHPWHESEDKLFQPFWPKFPRVRQRVRLECVLIICIGTFFKDDPLRIFMGILLRTLWYFHKNALEINKNFIRMREISMRIKYKTFIELLNKSKKT